MADAKLTALTETSVPALDDPIYTVDVSDTTDDAAGSSRKLSLQRMGGLLSAFPCQGRLTTQSGVPIPTAGRTAQSTIYFTPCNGSYIALYDGTRWNLHSFTERSLAIGTLSNDANYDIFVYDNAGTLTLELSAAWTNASTRSEALTTQDGVPVKSGATTRRHLGTMRTTSTTTIEQSRAKQFLWNRYQQILIPLEFDSGVVTHTYNSNTARSFNNSATNQVAFVCGEAVPLNYALLHRLTGSPSFPAIFASIDWTSGTPDERFCAFCAGANPDFSSSLVLPSQVVAAGYHYIRAGEVLLFGTTTSTFNRAAITGAIPG